VEGRFDSQDKTLKKIETKLDEHIESTGNFRKELTPVVEAFDTMKQGVQVIGKIGEAAGWIGKKLAAIALVVTAIFGALLAYHQWIGK